MSFCEAVKRRYGGLDEKGSDDEEVVVSGKVVEIVGSDKVEKRQRY